MDTARKKFTVVYACDNNFVPLLAASIKSLEVNSPGSLKEIYVINDGIKRSNLLKLSNSIESDEIILKFIPVAGVITKDIRIPYFNNASLPVTTFFRLFIQTFLPESVDKVLYLDCDTIILDDIAKIWDLNIDDHILAAVQDSGIRTFDCVWGGGVKNYKALGYEGDTLFFNAGILFINLKKWIEFEVSKKALDAAVNYRKYVTYGDQYCLNVVLGNKWLPMDPLWNHLVDNYHPEPKILHFIGYKPIYTNYSYYEQYRVIFFQYLNQTPWKDIKPVNSVTRKIRRIKRVLRKVFGY